MKKTNDINDLADLEAELSRLNTLLKVNRSAIEQQWIKAKQNVVRLTWNSIKPVCARSAQTAADQWKDLGATAFSRVMKWAAAKFKQ